jgi:2,4-dienoyl-CoA reductase-like NADH-dependent reductase (Old Yellow Enzyme family)
VIPGKKDVRCLTADEIESINDEFVRAAILAEEAGADGVDLKLVYAFLAGSLLHPSNVREDKWGGSFENRSRFLCRMVSSIQAQKKQPDFVVGSRISFYQGKRNGTEGRAAGYPWDEGSREIFNIVQLMDSLGMDFVSVAGGIPAAAEMPRSAEQYEAIPHLYEQKILKEAIAAKGGTLKVIGSGFSAHEASAPELAETMLEQNYTDLTGFGRQTLADPHYPRKIKNGEEVKRCVLCFGCLQRMNQQLKTACVVYENENYC